MESAAALWLALLILAVALGSRRLRESVLTAPMLLVAAGGVFGLVQADAPARLAGHGGLRLLFEGTLALVVFAAAARAGLARGPVQHARLVRLTFVALPLTVGLGTLLARVLWPHLAAGSALVAAALAAATDTEVARPFFEGRRTPPWAARLLEAEGGLTDGLLLSAAWLALEMAEGAAPRGLGYWSAFPVRAVGGAMVLGGAVGWAGGRLLAWGTRRGLFEPGLR